MNEWKVICRMEDIPVLGSRRVAREIGDAAAGRHPALDRPAVPAQLLGTAIHARGVRVGVLGPLGRATVDDVHVREIP